MDRIRLDLPFLITCLIIIAIIGEYFTRGGGGNSQDQALRMYEFMAWTINLLGYAIVTVFAFSLIYLRFLSNQDQRDLRSEIRTGTSAIIVAMLPLGLGTTILLLV